MKEFTFMGKRYKVEGNTAVEIENNTQEQDERAKWPASQSKSNKRDMGNSAPADLKELREKIEKEYKDMPLIKLGNRRKSYELKAKLELLNQVEEIIKNWILNLEKHFVLTYLKGTNERIIQFNPSVKVWEKEFKEKLLKEFEEKLK